MYMCVHVSGMCKCICVCLVYGMCVGEVHRAHKSTGQCSTVDTQCHLLSVSLGEAPCGIAESFVAKCMELMRYVYRGG